MKITITRKELMTYTTTVEVDDALATSMIENPEDHEAQLSQLCPCRESNWLDSEDPEFEVEQETEG